ncbi:MAG TPA: hypothetical protein VFZ24_18690 [Longimicrobiales bacterium]
MDTPTDEPTGPRVPRTTPPHGDPLKREPEPDGSESAEGEESAERPVTEPRPPDDPMRKDLPR